MRVLSLLVVTFGLLLSEARPANAQTGETVVFIVRHAERAEDGTSDPPISTAGEARSTLVAEIMRTARLTHLHSTDFKRTRSTLGPTVEQTGLALSVYNPRDLSAFAAVLRGTPGRHLVVGHSNTNPALVEALGGDPEGPIGEMEYDRFYVVVVRPGGDAGSAIFRFGAPSDQEPPDSAAPVARAPSTENASSK
jgi:broad specificity phosphatase PhoE